MDVKDIDNRLSDVEKKKIDAIVERIRHKGNFCETKEKEETLRKQLSILPSVCPCDICGKVRDRSKIESYGYPQVIVFKADDFSDDNILFNIVPFRHISNEEFLASPYWMFVGRLFIIMKNVMHHLYKDLNGFHVEVDNTYGDKWIEHACVRVKFLSRKS